MPVNSSRFNRFFWVLLACLAVQTGAQAQLPRLTGSELEALGRQIYANECASQPACLTSWNSGEDFPSLGIGHFIWYREQQNERFEETFPTLLGYLQQNSQTLPDWLSAAQQADAPWQDREQFLAARDSEQMRELRQLLTETQGLQAKFITQRLYESLPAILASAPLASREQLQQHVQMLANSSPPYGLYALIDYVHFKGSGVVTSERYQGEGWGLLQVLLSMPASAATLEDFIAAAESILRRRVENAPTERDEERWLQGWINRLQTYRPESGVMNLHEKH